MPRTTDETRPLPVLPSTRTSTILACGAMPTNSPAERVPLPAMMPAMCVPCPPGSSAVRGSAKFTEARMRFGPARSGSAATPESSTATVTPLPTMPVCQTCLALTTLG